MKLKKLNARGFSHEIVLVAFVAIFAIGGVAYLVASHADSCGKPVSGAVSSATSGPVSGSCRVHAAPAGSVVVYHYVNNKTLDHTLSLSPTSPDRLSKVVGYKKESKAFRAYKQHLSGTVAVHELYSSYYGHFYTMLQKNRPGFTYNGIADAGFTDNGIVFYAYPPKYAYAYSNLTGVILLQQQNKIPPHFINSSYAPEVFTLVKNGWRNYGPIFYVPKI